MAAWAKRAAIIRAGVRGINKANELKNQEREGKGENADTTK